MTNRSYMRARGVEPLTESCPNCGAVRNDPCKKVKHPGKTGTRHKGIYHSSRWKAASRRLGRNPNVGQHKGPRKE